jgi:hypothetical protein
MTTHETAPKRDVLLLADQLEAAPPSPPEAPCGGQLVNGDSALYVSENGAA